MKKALKIFGITIVVLFLILLILPFALKGKIVELIKAQANENLNAQVDFSDVRLSLIRNFPNLSVGIEELSLIGIEDFEGDTLTYMDELFLTVNVMSAIRGDEIEIKTIDLRRPVINILIHEDGKANYDIAKESDSIEEEESAEAASDVNLNIKSYSIIDGRVVYDDASLGFYLLLHGLDHRGNGDFSQEVFTLYTQSSIEAVDVKYGGIKYLRRAKADLKADIAMDFNEFKFAFMENELDVNRLELAFDGWLAMPGDDIEMDISFQSLRSDLLTILSLVPAEFADDLDGVEAQGTLSLDGYVKGIYNEASMPGYGIDLLVESGRIQYPDLPRSIENIGIESHIKSPGGSDMDLLTVDVPRFYMEIGKTQSQPNTVDAMLALRNPVSDPAIKTRVDADLDLGSFKDVLPLGDDLELKGIFAAHFALDGVMSDIEASRFDRFTAGGDVALQDFVYREGDMKVGISTAAADFSPQRFNISKLLMDYDEINMSFSGFVDNYVAYALKSEDLHGRFNFTADRIDLNRYMGESEEEDVEEQEEEESSFGIIEVPAGYDLSLEATIGEILYGEVSMKNVHGEIGIKERRAALQDLNFDMLGGNVGLNGSYSTANPEVPRVNFGFDLKNIDIDAMADAFRAVEKMAPIAKHASGAISSRFSIQTDLNAQMEPIYEGMRGSGNLRSSLLVLEGGEFIEKLSSTLKSPKLARQEIRNINLSFVIEDGRIVTSPFDVSINQMEANISGYSSFDQKIDYLMKMKVPRSELGSDFNKMAESLLSKAGSLFGGQGGLSLGETIKVDVRVHGDLSSPSISPSFAGMDDVVSSTKDQVKEKVEEKVQEVIDDTKEKAREEARKQADKILADAQRKADRVVSESADAARRIREEGERAAERILREAGSNPIAQAAARPAADRAREEANRRANQVEQEGKTQSDRIMKEARDEADRILQD